MLCPIHVSWPGLDSRGSGLADVFAELDMTSELLRIQISPDKPWFRLTTDGNAGTSQVDCPKDSDVIETFTCSQISVNDYNLKLIKPSEKALGLSEKISIRMNSWGVLSTQYLVQTGDGQNVFIEFLCMLLGRILKFNRFCDL